MAASFPFTRNDVKRFNIRAHRFKNVDSNSKMSEPTADVMRLWLFNRMIEIASVSTLGHGPVMTGYIAAHVAILQPLITAGIAGGAVIAAGPYANPAVPPTLIPEHTVAIDAHFHALEAAAAAAIPVQHPDYRFPFHTVLVPTADEYDELEWQIMKALAHSGFAASGKFRQVVQFTVMNAPTPPEYLTMEVDDFTDNFPTGTTAYNYGAYHATTIAINAKNEGIAWRWGKQHGCPAGLAWAGFSTWSFISDEMKIISDEDKEQLSAMSEHAIANKRVNAFVDPSLASDQTKYDMLKAGERANDIHQQNQDVRRQLARRRGGYRYDGGSQDGGDGRSSFRGTPSGH